MVVKNHLHSSSDVQEVVSSTLLDPFAAISIYHFPMGKKIFLWIHFRKVAWPRSPGKPFNYA
jgi:hypothetical protein